MSQFRHLQARFCELKIGISYRLAVCSAAAVGAAYLWAASAVSLTTRANGFGGIVAAYLGTCLTGFLMQWRTLQKGRVEERAAELDRSLRELEDAGSLAGSLKLEDLYRLIAHHIHPLLGCVSSTILVLDESRCNLRIGAVSGTLPVGLQDKEIIEGSLAVECFAQKRIRFSSVMDPDRKGLRDNYRLGLASAAVPLFRDSEVIGVVQFFFRRRRAKVEAIQPLLEKLGSTISSLVVKSIVYERNIAYAMEDPLLEMPNYRGFGHLLEDHLAASVQSRNVYSIAVLSVELGGFRSESGLLGWEVDDNILRVAASSLRDALRTMDVIAKGSENEFLIVLPSSDEVTTMAIVERIQSTFFSHLNDSSLDPVDIKLEIGSAVSGADGYTARSLIAHARLRKDRLKSRSEIERVVMFPGGRSIGSKV